MSNWTQMTQNMFKSLMDTQQMMWETMTDTAKTLSSSTSNTVWEQGINTWEKAINTMLDTQAAWIQTWATTTASMVNNDAANNMTGMMTGMADSWIKMQQVMWRNWFTVVRRLDPSKLGGSVQTDSTNLLESWQKQVQEMVEMQNKWFQQWTGAVRETPKSK
jgi:hypothetical protein